MLRWTNIFSWLIFPFLYLIIIVILGAASGFYPYPFVNVAAIGYPQLLINSALLLLTFLLLSFLLVALGKWKEGRKARFSGASRQ